jgi:hypothetical protein
MLAAFRKRLRIQFTRDVRLMVCAWPDAQSTLLTNWREMDPKMAVR